VEGTEIIGEIDIINGEKERRENGRKDEGTRGEGTKEQNQGRKEERNKTKEGSGDDNLAQECGLEKIFEGAPELRVLIQQQLEELPNNNKNKWEIRPKDSIKSCWCTKLKMRSMGSDVIGFYWV
jgi:hypothetical protein